MPVKKKDTDRALALLEEYCKKLKKPEEEQLKKAIKKVMGIFKSSLFQALIDIQEFYEVTLLNSQKSCEQKTEEANQVAEKWEKTKSSATGHASLQKNQESAVSGGSDGSVLCDEHNKENQSFENHSVDMTTKVSYRMDFLELQGQAVLHHRDNFMIFHGAHLRNLIQYVGQYCNIYAISNLNAVEFYEA
ncbi:unnamed protein product [Caretta caretta]